MKILCAECQHCAKRQDEHGEIVLVCVHPKTCERISNPQGLRIDKPEKYIKESGFPDWCPLEGEE